MNTFQLWSLLRKRSAGRSDPQKLTSFLAVIAFAVTTAVTLIVLGGWNAFAVRGENATGDEALYPALAATASALLLIPLSTLGAAAARLAMARRDERLAALRLAGATTRQVSALTLFEACSQALLGALIGVAGYFALIPIVQLVVFQQRPFSYAELLLPWWALPLAAVGVVAVAAVSAGSSLRKVSISPLGVAARVRPSPLHWSRLVPLAVVVVAFIAAFNSGQADTAILAAFLVGGLALLNLVGPLVIMLIGHIWASRAATAESLIGARRLIDNPKNAWRSVGGVGLATFIAGMAAVMAAFGTPGDPDPYLADMGKGGILTLVIAAVVAAVSTGVMQAGRVIDQRNEYRTLALAGMDMKLMNKARMKETRVPLFAAVGLAAGVTMFFIVPVLSMTIFTFPAVLIQYALSIIGAVALVLAGAAASSRVLKTVLA